MARSRPSSAVVLTGSGRGPRAPSGGEAAPAAVFLGGSGGRLDPILDLVYERLLPGGRFVANFVGLENLTRTLERMRAAGWTPEVTQVQVSQGQDLAGLTLFVPQRPVWVVSAARPGGR